VAGDRGAVLDVDALPLVGGDGCVAVELGELVDVVSVG